MASEESIHFLELPEEIHEHIFSYLTFHETSETRRVCRLFNKHCMQRLNKGFVRVDKFHAHIQKEVKNKLPRRESERRNHHLARHVDILSAIETRLSLLGMSYSKYMESGLCCFIPGKVLDELLSILFRLQCKEQPPRSHEFLQELRDISSMAMEHFDEKIAPNLKNKLPAITLPYPFSETCASTSAIFPFPPSPVRGPSMRSEVTSLGLQVRGQTSSVMQVRKEVVELKNCYTQYKKKIVEQEKKLVHQGQTIIELDKKVNDLNQKFVDLAAEFQKLREQKEGGEGLGGSVCHVSEKGGEEVNGFLAPAPGTSSKTTATKRRKRKSGGKAETAGKRSRRSNN